MKKLLIFITIILVNCSGGLKLSSDGEPEKAFVKSFLTLMLQDERDYDEMRKFIASSFLKENNAESCKVNSYFPIDFSIDSYDEGIIVSKIWGENKSWVHKLTFKVVIENEKYYLYPGGIDGEWVDPWINIETYVNE